MKQALSLLVAFTFIQSQTWALSGGPVFTTGGNTDLTGTYSGVLVGKSQTGVAPSPLSSGAAMGTFDITVPISGAASGNVVIFQNNDIFTGTINASADAGKRTIAGIIQATGTALFVVSETRTVTNTTTTPQTPPLAPIVTTTTQVLPAVTTALRATGSMQAKVSRSTLASGVRGNAGVNGVSRNAAAASTGGSTGTTGTTAPSLGETADRLSGTATIDLIADNTGAGTAGTIAGAVRAETKYSISGIRQTNQVSTTTGGGGGGNTGGGGGGFIFPFFP